MAERTIRVLLHEAESLMKKKALPPILSTILITLLVSVTCTVQKKQVLPDVKLTKTVSDSAVNVPVDTIRNFTPDTKPTTIDIDGWVKKEFIILPKQQMFKVHGYEIYLSKDLDKAKSPPDTALELKNHRIRSDKIANHLITCISVQSTGTEWFMECYDSLLNRPLYMVSYKGAFKDLLYKDDLTQASLRWTGKTIFSRRGLISAADKNGSFSSIRVDVRDSLIVQSVTAGVTPLPVKPLWINVMSKNITGFIPVRFSWTNCMADIITDSLPWAEDILETDPALFGWSDTMWEVINNHRVINEMSKAQVLVSWGYPDSIVEAQGTTGECWRYQAQKVCFVNGLVSAVSSE